LNQIMFYRPTDFNDPDFYDPDHDDLKFSKKLSKRRARQCSDGTCGCEDCETCFPLLAQKVAGDYFFEEGENEN